MHREDGTTISSPIIDQHHFRAHPQCKMIQLQYCPGYLESSCYLRSHFVTSLTTLYVWILCQEFSCIAKGYDMLGKRNRFQDLEICNSPSLFNFWRYVSSTFSSLEIFSDVVFSLEPFNPGLLPTFIFFHVLLFVDFLLWPERTKQQERCSAFLEIYQK